jgi:hypothetical protein
MQSIVKAWIVVWSRASASGICFLDARLTPHQNVGVGGRLIAIAIALAVLAFAEIRYDAQV